MQAKASSVPVESAGLADGSTFDGEGEDLEAVSTKGGMDKEGEAREQQQLLGKAGDTHESLGTSLTPRGAAVHANTSHADAGSAEPQRQQGHRRSSRQAERNTGAGAAAGAAAPAARGSPHEFSPSKDGPGITALN
jgi:hypothetical protein